MGYYTTTAEDIYWQDGSYAEVSSESQAHKVSYFSDNHSAITTSTSEWFVSKWGVAPLMKHVYNDCPYNSSSLKYYKRNYLTVDIDGPTLLSQNQTGTYTAEVRGVDGTKSYQWYRRNVGSGSWTALGTGQSQDATMYETDFEIKVHVSCAGKNAQDIELVQCSDCGGPLGPLTSVVSGGKNNFPETYILFQNNPNPFNPTTEIKYELPENSHVTLTIFNLVGQKIRTLVDEQQNAGYYSIPWDSKDEFGQEVASGIYFYRISVRPTEAGGKPFEAVRKMTLLR
jgi:hypothetical protein